MDDPTSEERHDQTHGAGPDGTVTPPQPWREARARLDGLPGGRGLNIAHEAVDRHVLHGNGGRTALRCIDLDADVESYSYDQLHVITNKFAGVLDTLGIGPGETVFTLLGRGLETYVVALGTLKHRSVLSPLFSAFGPEPIRQRLTLGHARVLVTTADAVPRRSRRPPGPAARARRRAARRRRRRPPDTRSYLGASRRGAATLRDPADRPGDAALLHFTSGTTGTPKGALHVHEAVVAHHATGPLRARARTPGTCSGAPPTRAGSPGCRTAIIAPLACGATVVFDDGEFDARRWYRILAGPGGHRLVHGADGAADAHAGRPGRRPSRTPPPPAPRRERRRAAQRRGGRLGPGRASGCRSSTTGGRPRPAAIMIANPPGDDRPRPARWAARCPASCAIVARAARTAGPRSPTVDVREVARGETGELALRPGWPSMFRGYLDDEERYRELLRRRLVPDGDLARRDEDGWYWFVGRADDVIKSAGHLIGPFEVESGLMEHPAVAEAGVIGKPDPIAGQIVQGVRDAARRLRAHDDLRMELIALRPPAPRRRRRPPPDRLRPAPAARPAAARSCAGCCRRASSGCPRATSRPWRTAR